MPTETKFIALSGASYIDLSGIFADLDGGTSYGTATKFRVGSVDLTGYFHASTSVNDRPNFNTGYKVNGTDLSAIFRRRGFVGINITAQPQPQIVVNNTSATFSVTATASGAITYQWYGPAGLISGATNSSYTITTATIANDGSYYCALTSGGSTLNSSSAILKIKPYIVTQPVGGSFNDGDGISLSIVAGGSQVLFYQWYKDGILISGATSSSYPSVGQFTLNSTTKGTYTCKVTSTYDNVGQTSSGAVLSIIIPDISLGITDFTPPFIFDYNTVVTLTITKNAGSNVIYSWAGPNGSITNGQGGYSILNEGTQLQFQLSASNDGVYTATATNGGGSDSASATISILPPIVTATSSQFIYNNGNGVSLTSSLTQGSNATYQWYGPNGIINGATNSTYSFTMSSSTYGNYYVRATNAGGFDDSGIVTVYMNPLINSGPSPATANAGSTASFNVSAVGSPSLSYQWYKNGSSIFGATGSSYTTPTLTSSDNGSSYYCVVSSNATTGMASAQSSSATLTVNFVATIGSVSVDGTTVTSNLQEFSIENGTSFNLSASSINYGNPTASGGWYRWGGQAYSDFLSSSTSYNLTQADNSTQYYRFILNNSAGAGQSLEITIVTFDPGP